MSNLREAFSATAYANLDWSEIAERAIDRVAASGKATELGVSLWKVRYLLEASARPRAYRLSLEAFQGRYRDRGAVAEQIVEQALREYIDMPLCAPCRGQGGVIFDGKWVTCDVCQGNKIRRWSDKDRANRMAISYAMVKASAHKIAWLLGLFEEQDRRVNYTLNIELERLAIV